jgi:Tfp pilus assembly protein PilX
MMCANTTTFERRGWLKRQTGAATLILFMLLLLGTSIAVFYLNRSLIFEQKTSAGQYRATTALEAAEAGIEWVTGMLNTPYDIDSACAPLTTTNISFRKKYVQTMYNDPTSPSSDVIPVTTVYPGCKMSGTTLTCGCPAANVPGAAVPSNSSAKLPSFVVAFAKVPIPGTSPVAYDTESVQVTSYGCVATDDGSMCSTSGGSADAYSKVTVILKMRPLLRAAPASAITCGTTCNIGGSFSIANTDPGTNGILVNSGGAAAPGSNLTTLSGQPTSNATVQNDSSLSTLASNDPTCTNASMFNAYFGATLTQYQDSPSTKTISCGSPSACGAAVNAAYDDGWRSFYFPDGFSWNNASGNLGTQLDPVTIVSPGQISINGNIDVYGLVFSNDADSNSLNPGSGTSNIHGALVTCRSLTVNGHGTVTYDPDALKNIRRSTSVMARVPGSWRDF